MSSSSVPSPLAEPRWLERRRITRAGRRDRIRFRALPFHEHTPWTRSLHARYLGLALDARQVVLDRRMALEQERQSQQLTVRLHRATSPTERPAEPSGSLDRHLWALQARRDQAEAERFRAAQHRLTQIEVELNHLGERLAYVTSLHEQAYLLRIHVYNAARTTARTAAAGSQAAPALVLPPDPETAQPHLFTYAIAA
jgi:hypothetical protein